MFNTNNLQDLEFSHVTGRSYRGALNELEEAVKKHFKEFGYAVQPFGLGSKTINIEVQNNKVPIEIESIVPRPITYEEQAKLIVELDQETANKILSMYKYTITSVAYLKGDNSQYKIVPISKKLLRLSPGFNQSVIETDYKNVDGILIKKGKEKYKKHLTDEEYNNHPAYITLIPDKNTRIEFRKKLKQTYKSMMGREAPKEFMSFWLDNSKRTEDYERAVCLGDYYDNYYTYADDRIDSYTRFLLVTPRKKIKNGKK